MEIKQCDVLVLDARLRQSLAAVRSLGARSIRVAAMETHANAPTFSSRWCRYSFSSSAEEGSEEYFDSLAQALDATRARVVIASSDGTIELLRRHRAQLETRAQPTRLALAGEPALGIAIDKRQTLEIAARLGLKVPRGIVVSKADEAQSALREVGLPAVIKPTTSWSSNGQQSTRLASRLVTTPDEALRAVEELTRFGGKTLFQQFLPGRCEAIGLFYAHGEILARFAYWAKRSDPPLGGTDVMGQSIPLPPDTGEQAARLIREIGLEGYALVEFRRDSCGQPYLMEINARLNAGISHAVDAGVDFPYMLYQWAAGEQIDAVKTYRTGKWMRYLSGDIATTAASLAQRGRPGVNPPARAILDFAVSFFIPAHYDYLDWRDPLPALRATAGWFRGIPRLIGRAFAGSDALPSVGNCSRGGSGDGRGGEARKAPARGPAPLPATPASTMNRHPTKKPTCVSSWVALIHPKECRPKLHMSRSIEFALAACLYYSGIVKLARWWTRRRGPRLVVLCYHRATGGSLRQHLLYLRRHYRILHLEAALEALYRQEKSTFPWQKQRPLLALTFDDGYYDNYTEAFALARALQVPITIFLVPGYIESGRRFWWYEPRYLLRHAQASEATIEGRTYHLRSEVERSALEQAIETRLRNASSVEDRESYLAAVRAALLAPTSASDETRAAFPLTWDLAREMQESGWVSFDAHTMHHPTLACLSDPAELEYEVSECRAVLHEQLGHPVRAFAYPIGKDEHIGENGLAAVRAARYDWALTTLHGINTPQTDPQLLHRFVVDVDQHWLMIAAKSSGAWDLLLHPFRKPPTPVKGPSICSQG